MKNLKLRLTNFGSKLHFLPCKLSIYGLKQTFVFLDLLAVIHYAKINEFVEILAKLLAKLQLRQGIQD